MHELRPHQHSLKIIIQVFAITCNVACFRHASEYQYHYLLKEIHISSYRGPRKSSFVSNPHRLSDGYNQGKPVHIAKIYGVMKLWSLLMRYLWLLGTVRDRNCLRIIPALQKLPFPHQKFKSSKLFHSSS
jgi:hypothetical protein